MIRGGSLFARSGKEFCEIHKHHTKRPTMDNGSTTAERLTDALKVLEEAAKEKKEELKHLITDKYSVLKDAFFDAENSASERFDNIKVKSVEAAANAKEIGEEKAKEIANNVDESVHKNPWPYIGGVAVGSLLLGYILGRK